MSKKIKGNKKEVYDGIAEKTATGLKKEDLILSKNGKIISKKMLGKGKKKQEQLPAFEEVKEDLIENNNEISIDPENEEKPKIVRRYTERLPKDYDH